MVHMLHCGARCRHDGVPLLLCPCPPLLAPPPQACRMPAADAAAAALAAAMECADGKHPKTDTSFFQRREFCFTLDGDIFVRYQSFKASLCCC